MSRPPRADGSRSDGGGAGATGGRPLRIEVDQADAGHVFGVRDANLRAIEQATGARLAARGTTVHVEGPDEAVRLASAVLTELVALVGEGVTLKGPELESAARLMAQTPGVSLRQLLVEEAVAPSERRRLLARTPVQQAYVRAIRSKDLVFGIGPAGTGKTYLAVALALEALRERSVRRIVLTRPAVEAGERLGFLPGDLVQKINPYLRPLNDAIRDLADADLAQALLERGDLEVAPLAFMRGRTLSDAFIILDEAQNTTHEQMKMFLTRMGFNSKVVVTGDVTQVDLPPGRVSGLAEAARILSSIQDIAIVRFGERDVVRHGLVRRIVQAYDRDRASWQAIPDPSELARDRDGDAGDRSSGPSTAD